MRKMLARIDKSADPDAMKHIYNMPISPAVIATAKSSNELHLSQARAWANHILDKHVSAAPEGVPTSNSMEVISIPNEADEDFVVASEFLKLEAIVAMAAEQGNVQALNELATYFGYWIFNLLARASTGKSFPYGLTTLRSRIDGSRKGGNRKTVWERAEKDATKLFEEFKLAGLSDNAALLRTKGGLAKLQKEGRFNAKVPGLTTLRKNLVGKTSFGR